MVSKNKSKGLWNLRVMTRALTWWMKMQFSTEGTIVLTFSRKRRMTKSMKAMTLMTRHRSSGRGTELSAWLNSSHRTSNQKQCGRWPERLTTKAAEVNPSRGRARSHSPVASSWGQARVRSAKLKIDLTSKWASEWSMISINVSIIWTSFSREIVRH